MSASVWNGLCRTPRSSPAAGVVQRWLNLHARRSSRRHPDGVSVNRVVGRIQSSPSRWGRRWPRCTELASASIGPHHSGYRAGRNAEPASRATRCPDRRVEPAAATETQDGAGIMNSLFWLILGGFGAVVLLVMVLAVADVLRTAGRGRVHPTRHMNRSANGLADPPVVLPPDAVRRLNDQAHTQPLYRTPDPWPGLPARGPDSPTPLRSYAYRAAKRRRRR
jgi:hypothetical protein